MGQNLAFREEPSLHVCQTFALFDTRQGELEACFASGDLLRRRGMILYGFGAFWLGGQG